MLKFFIVCMCLVAMPFTINAGKISDQIPGVKYQNHFSTPLKSGVAFSQSKSTQRIMDDFIKFKAKKYYITGIPFAFQCKYFDDNQAVTYNSGMQSIDGKLMSNNSLWQIGSNSKSFLSVVILQLEAENRLSINDRVSKYLSADIYPKWQDITLKQLLNMTSGIHDYANDETEIFNVMKVNPYHNFSTDEILDSVKELDLWFEPGTKWKYSNTNYVIAGKIVERITGNSVASEITSRIINPLNLKHTYYVTSFPKENIPLEDSTNIMSGYYGLNDGPNFPVGVDIIDYSMSWGNAAGSITSTTSDLNKYVHSLFEGKLLPQKQFNELVEEVDSDGQVIPGGVNELHPEGYGLGIVGNYASEIKSTIYSHGGGTLGFSSSWQYIVATQASTVFSLNTSKELDDDNFVFISSLMESLPKSCIVKY